MAAGRNPVDIHAVKGQRLAASQRSGAPVVRMKYAYGVGWSRVANTSAFMVLGSMCTAVSRSAAMARPSVVQPS
jgi:hypothetical protein